MGFDAFHQHIFILSKICYLGHVSLNTTECEYVCTLIHIAAKLIKIFTGFYLHFSNSYIVFGNIF